MKRLAWSAGLALFGAARRGGAPPANPAKTENAPMNVSDSEFVQQSTEAQLAEINFGRLAVEQSSNPEVKAFGQRMVDDHTKGLDEEDKAASKAGITPAQSMNAQDRETLTKLSGLQGAAFDAEYVPAQVTAHKKAIALFEAEARTGKNADVKAVAEKLLPVLREHLRLAEKLASSKTAATDGKTNTGK